MPYVGWAGAADPGTGGERCVVCVLYALCISIISCTVNALAITFLSRVMT